MSERDAAADGEGAPRVLPANGWSRIYARCLLATDFLVLVWVVFGVQIAWLGLDSNVSATRNTSLNLNDATISYTAVSLIVIAVWLGALTFYGSRGDRVIGTGSAEYRLVADTSLRVFGLFAIVAFLAHLDLARGYILIAFPVGTLILLFSRWLWRQWLIVQRARGLFSARVMLVGSRTSVEFLARQLTRQPEAGYLVIGACVPGGARGGVLAGGLRVYGDFDDVAGVLGESGADTVVITSSDDLPPHRVRELSWNLEPGRQHLVVAPSLIDIGGPRIHTRPVQGLPLIHVEIPTYEGRKLYSKRLFDIVASVSLIVLLSPLLGALALIVRLTSSGAILFRQERVGLNGKPFRMMKFRTMVADAEDRLQEVRALDRSEGNPVLFKMKDDPRVTRVGRLMRRFSLDELAQLFNVLRGSMSIVGPRPPLQREVDLYDLHVHRRFLVKPGMTGLWQVSGRSKLSWEDSVRLDLFYVENWSIVGDLVILTKTVRAVAARDGAY